jgi:hypothetical protein
LLAVQEDAPDSSCPRRRGYGQPLANEYCIFDAVQGMASQIFVALFLLQEIATHRIFVLTIARKW